MGRGDEQIRPVVLAEALETGQTVLDIRPEVGRARFAGRHTLLLSGVIKGANVVFSYVNRDMMTALTNKNAPEFFHTMLLVLIYNVVAALGQYHYTVLELLGDGAWRISGTDCSRTA